VLFELVPGGIAKEITAAHATRVLESIEAAGAARSTGSGLACAAGSWRWPSADEANAS
jgi:hypothetical protein